MEICNRSEVQGLDVMNTPYTQVQSELYMALYQQYIVNR
jgi:hypothetical protein